MSEKHTSRNDAHHKRVPAWVLDRFLMRLKRQDPASWDKAVDAGIVPTSSIMK